MFRSLLRLDRHVISFANHHGLLLARLALALVYGWFGILKLIGASPANPLVDALLGKTLPFLTFGQFIIILGWWEVAIAIAFLIPRLERVAILLVAPHLVVTAMPLCLLPSLTWQSNWIPTLEGQYIIKNAVLAALALSVAGHLEPLNRR